MAEEGNITLDQLIIETIKEMNIIKKMNSALFLIRRFKNTETYEKAGLKKLEDALCETMKDSMRMRIIYYRQSLLDSPESYMYFGSDKGKNDPYIFLGKLESIITDLNDNIITTLASLYNELFEDELDFS